MISRLFASFNPFSNQQPLEIGSSHQVSINANNHQQESIEKIYFKPIAYYPIQTNRKAIEQWVESFLRESDINTDAGVLWIDQSNKVNLSFVKVGPYDKIGHFTFDDIIQEERGALKTCNGEAIVSIDALILHAKKSHLARDKNKETLAIRKLLKENDDFFDESFVNRIMIFVEKEENSVYPTKQLIDSLKKSKIKTNKIIEEELKNINEEDGILWFKAFWALLEKQGNLFAQSDDVNQIINNQSAFKYLISTPGITLIPEEMAEGVRLSLAVQYFDKWPDFLTDISYRNFFEHLARWSGEVRDGLICPLSSSMLEKITDPYIAANGISYDGKNIKPLFSRDDEQEIKKAIDDFEKVNKNKKLYKNVALKEVIEFFKELNDPLASVITECRKLYSNWLMLKFMRNTLNQIETLEEINDTFEQDIENLKKINNELPSLGTCVISGFRMEKPIVIDPGEASDDEVENYGTSFEKKKIEEWLTRKETHPTTRKKIDKAIKISNTSLERPLRVLQHLEWAIPILIIFSEKLQAEIEKLKYPANSQHYLNQFMRSASLSIPFSMSPLNRIPYSSSVVINIESSKSKRECK